ncbi:putative 3-methyladenine DNA glycosylase [Rhopalosiphum padi]|uniref:putative 3-methyladenine DNA glycosylase n=1 Tax=Rhopalosiphum padi TaxID=40932 RepID=UPI00298E9E3D|nr:putative 3-methyladenine DNA glycosylase [Rhopalosiphum padi]
MSENDQCESEYFSSGPVQYRKRLDAQFYETPCEEMAMSLLGKILVRRLDDNTLLRGRIVETESYLGNEDAASQSFKGKITPRNEPMFMKPGTAYVYFTYGMYHCFNISSKGDGAAVLIRALEPLDNLNTMASLRKQFRKCSKTQMQNKDLCNGPAKLCISFAIDIKSCNKQDLTSWDGMWVEEDENSKLIDTIVCSPRIGIKCEKIWQDKYLRYYIRDNPCVSKIEKTKMNELKYSQIENIK